MIMEDETASGDSGCCCDMPMEVLNEILIYLPVKSLIRFTCVCKYWLHLIRNDPQFAVKHYLSRTTKPSRLMNNVDYIVDYFGKYGRSCGSITSEEVLRLSIYSLTEKKTFSLVKKIEFGPGLGVSVSNFCHGIMCVFLCTSALRAKILLFNPAIRELVPIPISINIATHGRPKFGLGFDPTNNDYKIVAIHPPAILSGRVHWLVDLYFVCNGCWHSVQAIAPLEKFASLDGEPALNANGRILNWLGYHKNSAQKSLVSFDMVDEVFKETALPECLYSNSWRQHHLLSSSLCQACFCCSSFPSFDLIKGNEFFNGIDIWVLNDSTAEGGNMWSKQVSFRFPNQEMIVWPLNIWMNDKELFVYMQKKKGGVEEVFHYDLGTQELKRTGRSGTLINPDGYSESLVSIKGFMSSSSSSQGAAQGSNGNGNGNGNGNDGENQEQKDDDGSVCFIREVGRRNDDVRWSYSFNLV